MSNFATGLTRYTDNCSLFSKENIAAYNAMHKLVHEERTAVMKLKIDDCTTARAKFKHAEPNCTVPFLTKRRTPAKAILTSACDDVLLVDLADVFDMDAEMDSEMRTKESLRALIA